MRSARRFLVKEHHRVDALQSGEHVGHVSLADNRSALTPQCSNGSVGIQADHQAVALGPWHQREASRGLDE